jgi:tetratricopeptide (TPR) repeat protein
MNRRKRVAVFATEPVTEKIGGLGIRQLQVARTLKKHFEVRLLTPFKVGSHHERFPVEQITYEDASTFESHVQWADSVYAIALSVIPVAQKHNKPLAVDILVPEYFENLEGMPLDSFHSQEKSDRFAGTISRLTRLLTTGDFFMCPNEKTRDFYLGMLTQLGRLRPHDYPEDPQFRSLIDVAPFGIPRREPKKGKTLLRNKIPGIGPKDFLILWGGSLANWFDSETVVRAMARLKKRLPRAKLVICGKKHPVWGKLPKAYQKVMDLAQAKGIFNKSVFIYTDWVPYEQHEYYLSEADVGIVTFRNHIENHFCCRIRVTDYLWGNLPILTNPGNLQSKWIESQEMGKVVPFGNDKALAEAIEWMATHPAALSRMRTHIAREKKSLYWDRVLAPLIRFCKNPKRTVSLFQEDGISPSQRQNSFSYQPDQLLRSMPNHPHLQLLRARKSLETGNRKKAVQEIQEHLQWFGSGLESSLFRQPLFHLDTEFDYEQLLDLIPDHPHAGLMKAKLKLDDGQTQAAIAWIEEEESLFGESRESRFVKGLAYQASQDQEKALGCFESVSQALPGHLAFRLPVADSLAALGENSKAREIYTQTWRDSQTGPHSGEEWMRTHIARAMARLEKDKRSELDTLTLYFDRDPTNEMLAQVVAEHMEETGRQLMNAGDQEAARKLYQKAWRRHGRTAGEGWVRVIAALSLAKLDARRRPEIETLYGFMKEDPENERLAYAIASSMEKQGQREEARTLFEKCTQTFKAKSMLGSAWYRLALLSPENQQKQMVKNCLELYPSHSEARALWTRLDGSNGSGSIPLASLKVL